MSRQHRSCHQKSQNIPLHAQTAAKGTLAMERYVQEVDHYKAFLVCDQPARLNEWRVRLVDAGNNRQSGNAGMQNGTQGQNFERHRAILLIIT